MMDLNKDDGLVIEALVEGTEAGGDQMFMLLLRDSEGKQRYTIFGCKPNYADQVVKSFQRIHGIRPPSWVEEVKPEEQVNPEVKEDGAVKQEEDNQSL